MDDTTLMKSRFLGEHSKRDRLCHHLATTTTVLQSYITRTVEADADAPPFYIFARWDKNDLDHHLEAYVRDYEYTARQFIKATTITAYEVDQIISLSKCAHLLCCLIASTRKWPRPAHRTFVASAFTDLHSVPSTGPTIPMRRSTHPTDPSGGIMYTARPLIQDNGPVIHFGALWMEGCRTVFTDSFAPDGSDDSPMPQDAWRTSSTSAFPPTLQSSSIQHGTMPAGTYANMAHAVPSIPNARASHTDSTSSGIFLHSARGNIWLKKAKGMSDFPHLSVETQTFTNIVPGEWDSNGLESAAYRKEIGPLFSKALFANKDSDFYDMASVVYANLNKLDLQALEDDNEHWFQLARALDPHFACVVARFRKNETTLVSLYSATTPACDPTKGHPTKELPLPALYELLLIWRTMENQTATSLMGLEEKFNNLLEYGSGAFLNAKWLAKLADLVTQLRRAPPAIAKLLAHLPHIMARRAVNITMRIPVDSPMYHRIILDELQKKVFLQMSANFTASISAGSPSVTIGATTTSPGPQSPSTPYRRPTPGPPPQRRSRHPPPSRTRPARTQRGRLHSRSATSARRTCRRKSTGSSTPRRALNWCDGAPSEDSPWASAPSAATQGSAASAPIGTAPAPAAARGVTTEATREPPARGATFSSTTARSAPARNPEAAAAPPPAATSRAAPGTRGGPSTDARHRPALS